MSKPVAYRVRVETVVERVGSDADVALEVGAMVQALRQSLGELVEVQVAVQEDPGIDISWAVFRPDVLQELGAALAEEGVAEAALEGFQESAE